MSFEINPQKKRSDEAFQALKQVYDKIEHYLELLLGNLHEPTTLDAMLENNGISKEQIAAMGPKVRLKKAGEILRSKPSRLEVILVS